MFVYTESLPYDPLTDTGIRVRSEPEALFTAALVQSSPLGKGGERDG